MKYWKIIFLSFIIGCIMVLSGLVVLHSQQVRHHPASDMVGLAYGLATAFNIVLAFGSLPVVPLKSRETPKLWQTIALLFALPLVFTIAVTWSMDFYALFYCLPYLCSVVFLFGIRMAQQRNKPFQKIKTGDPTKALDIRSPEIVSENYLRLQVYSGNTPCGTIDFIGGKINFNILGRSFFKGIEAIKNVQLEYNEGRLIFRFRNRKTLEFHCTTEVFEAVTTHVGTYKVNF